VKIAAVMVAVMVACSDPRELSQACDGGTCTTQVHQPGITDPSSPNFHVNLLEQLDWGFATCQGCHGSDFAGGTSGVSCLQCHAAKPTDCVTCHGAGPTSNAHVQHAGVSVACAECHVVPTSWDQDGHILHDGVAITAPAKVTFGALANATLDPAARAGSAAFDGATCTNVYCHGSVLTDGGGTATSPQWTDPTPLGCSSRCHGQPPPTHALTNCATCHPPSAPHIDGIVQVGRTPGCSGCHGSASSPAPPVDLSGNTFTTALGVGAHQAHLQAPSRISAPIPCATCHVVPTSVDSPGHIDHTGPAIVTAALGWDRTAQSCTTAWCHGPSQPIWTRTGQVSCGSCHGIPPSDAAHNSTMTLTSCATCHPGTVDAFGNIIVTNGTSEHMNGVVDLD
jgi:predicted CxxxxCH...CXXCH cytochrome family protein